MQTIIQNEKVPLQDHCGIVAAFATKDAHFFSVGLRGLSILQTRGYDGAGYCALDTTGKTYSYRGIGMVNEVFHEAKVLECERIAARVWVYQVRYGTSGDVIADNVQPLQYIHASSQEFYMVAHNGQFADEKGVPKELSDTVHFARQLGKAKENTWDERIQTILSQKKGAWSLVIGTKDALYLARDYFGVRPLSYGHVWDQTTKQFIWVVASETSALEAMGVTTFFEVLPGSIAKITPHGFTLLNRSKNSKRALCIFENIYIQHGAGKAHLPRTGTRMINKSPTIDDVRRRSGKILAREAPLTQNEVDMVIGVPGTGIEGGMLFARTLNLPYLQVITDKSSELYEQRTFMTSKIESIYQKVLDHFNFDAQALRNRRVVIVDDSIVRGNITKGLVYLLKKYYHVDVVHVRILSPAIDKACHLGVNTRHENELVAAIHSGDVEKIRTALNADSLAYLSPEGLREALTGDRSAKGFCMGCMVGFKSPVDRLGNLLRQQPKLPHKQKQLPDKTVPLPVMV